jgi:NAD(P)-dependent dehydrogenase (short-subunit alcohol dehydrogenase family)
MSRLPSRVALVTGSSSGIGRAIALLFASHGAAIVCADLTPTARAEYPTDASSAQQTHDLIAARGGRAIFVKCDTSVSADVEAAVDAAVAEYGRLDIMVNNAGISPESWASHGPRPVWECDEGAFEKAWAVNVKGVWAGVKFACRQMLKQEPLVEGGDRGWIVNLASIKAMDAAPGLCEFSRFRTVGPRGRRTGLTSTAGYVTSKHAVLGLTRAAAWDCAPHRIHVNALCPGFTQSAFIHGLLESPELKARVEAQHPFRGLGTVEDVARAALFLVSEDASWVTGIGLPVDGGFTSGSDL